MEINLHIYDMKLDKGVPVILSGTISPDEALNFAGYLKILQTIFSDNPVIYVPDEMTIDAMEHYDFVNLLCDAMSVDALEKLYGDVEEAFMKKSGILKEGNEQDEV